MFHWSAGGGVGFSICFAFPTSYEMHIKWTSWILNNLLVILVCSINSIFTHCWYFHSPYRLIKTWLILRRRWKLKILTHKVFKIWLDLYHSAYSTFKQSLVLCVLVFIRRLWLWSFFSDILPIAIPDFSRLWYVLILSLDLNDNVLVAFLSFLFLFPSFIGTNLASTNGKYV